MRVVLDPQLFAPPLEHLSLPGLFDYGVRDEHRIDVDLEHPAVVAWLEAQPADARALYVFAVESSAEQEMLHPSATSIFVTTVEQSSWDSEPPRLTLSDTRRLLRRTFEIYVEDGTNDRAFLLAMMKTEERDLIEQLEQEERLQFVHGGGSRLKTEVGRRAELPGARLQTWVLTDSDAMRPGAPSRGSQDVVDVCTAARIPHHRLGRRYIESYLPPAALERWGAARPSRRRTNLPIARAFGRMSGPQRHHFNMKEGFDADMPRRGEADGLYDELDALARERLGPGFGRKIGELFQGRYPGSEGNRPEDRLELFEQELRRDGGWEELRPAIRELLAHLGVS